MHRIHGAVITASAAVMLIAAVSACAEETPKIPEPVTALSGEAAEAELGETKLGCSITRTEGGISSITISSPEGLKGLSFKSSGGSYAISYNGLSCETENSLLPSSCFAQAISNVLDKASEENGAVYQKTEDNSAVFSGTSESGAFTLCADSRTGKIQKIEIPEKSITVTFTENQS